MRENTDQNNSKYGLFLKVPSEMFYRVLNTPIAHANGLNMDEKTSNKRIKVVNIFNKKFPSDTFDNVLITILESNLTFFMRNAPKWSDTLEKCV